MEERQRALDLSTWSANNSQVQKLDNSPIRTRQLFNSSNRVGSMVRAQQHEKKHQQDYRQMLLRVMSEKEQMRRRREHIEKINGEKESLKLKEEETLMEEVRNLKKSTLKQRLEYQRILRSKKEEERKSANEAYLKFIREYHRVRPLHQLRQYEFQMKEQLELREKESERRSKQDILLKPLSMHEFEEHQRKYLEDKRKIQRQLINRRLQLSHQTSRKDYFRGRSHQIVEEESRKMSVQPDKEAALVRIRNYYQNILKKLYKPPKHAQFKEPVPSQVPSVDRRERLKSLGDEYLRYSKERRRTQPRELSDNVLPNTQPTSPHTKPLQQGFDSGYSTRRPPVPHARHRHRPKPISIRDHYDVEELIYQNSRKDQFIRRVEELSQYQPSTEFDELEVKYIDSIREKLSILNSLT